MHAFSAFFDVQFRKTDQKMAEPVGKIELSYVSDSIQASKAEETHSNIVSTPPHKPNQRGDTPGRSNLTKEAHSPTKSNKKLDSSRPGSASKSPQRGSGLTPQKSPNSTPDKKPSRSPKKTPYITPSRSPRPHGSPNSPGQNFSPNRTYSTNYPVKIGVKRLDLNPSETGEGSDPTSLIVWDIADQYRAAGVFAFARRPKKDTSSTETEELVGLVLCERRENKKQLTFPGGKIDPKDNQNPLTTAIREFHEETRSIFGGSDDKLKDQFVRNFPENCFYAPYGKYFLTALELPYKEDIYEAFLSGKKVEDKTERLFWLALPSFNTRDPKIKIDGEEYGWHRFTMSLLKDNHLQALLQRVQAGLDTGSAPVRTPNSNDSSVDAITADLESLKV